MVRADMAAEEAGTPEPGRKLDKAQEAGKPARGPGPIRAVLREVEDGEEVEAVMAEAVLLAAEVKQAEVQVEANQIKVILRRLQVDLFRKMRPELQRANQLLAQERLEEEAQEAEAKEQAEAKILVQVMGRAKADKPTL